MQQSHRGGGGRLGALWDEGDLLTLRGDEVSRRIWRLARQISTVVVFPLDGLENGQDR